LILKYPAYIKKNFTWKSTPVEVEWMCCLVRILWSANVRLDLLSFDCYSGNSKWRFLMKGTL